MGLLLLCPLGWEAMLMVQLWEKAIAAFFVFVSEPIYVTVYIRTYLCHGIHSAITEKVCMESKLVSMVGFYGRSCLRFTSSLRSLPLQGPQIAQVQANSSQPMALDNSTSQETSAHQNSSTNKLLMPSSSISRRNLRSRTLGFRLVHALSRQWLIILYD
jgi:hypothetical protein